MAKKKPLPHHVAPPSQPTEPLVGPPEAARLLGLTAHTLAVWRCSKRQCLPFVRLGGRIRYRPADIERFIKSNTVGASAD